MEVLCIVYLIMFSLKELVGLGKKLGYKGEHRAENVKKEQAQEHQVGAEERQQCAEALEA